MEFYKIEDVGYEINKDRVVRRIHKTVASKVRAQHIDTRGYYSITLYKKTALTIEGQFTGYLLKSLYQIQTTSHV